MLWFSLYFLFIKGIYITLFEENLLEDWSRSLEISEYRNFEGLKGMLFTKGLWALHFICFSYACFSVMVLPMSEFVLYLLPICIISWAGNRLFKMYSLLLWPVGVGLNSGSVIFDATFFEYTFLSSNLWSDVLYCPKSIV